MQQQLCICLSCGVAGSVRYAYHRFGPLRPDMPPLRPTALSVARKDPAPVVFISGAWVG
jgi:hypothetical protein